MKRGIRLMVLLAVFAMIAAACGDSSDDTTTAGSRHHCGPGHDSRTRHHRSDNHGSSDGGRFL